ncbi:MAG TPA: hypothetical protein VGF84_17465 [Micromonosporaceae bacterium]|jgi:hypothetical protein
MTINLATDRVHSLRFPVPALAGIAYSLAWIAGLAVFSSSTNVRSTGAQIVAADSGHTAVLVAQFVLTEGVASIALAVVAVALGRALGRAVVVTGVAAAVIALVQCALGITLTMSLGQAGTVATLNDTINRLDGLKMFVLAAMAVAAVRTTVRSPLPRWLRLVGAALAVAIIVSGLGYGLLNSSLAVAAWLSLPLLLVFVTGAGIVVGRRTANGS